MIITDKAMSYIEEIMQQNEGSTLRFNFEGEGCCDMTLWQALNSSKWRINYLSICL